MIKILIRAEQTKNMWFLCHYQIFGSADNRPLII